MLTLAVALDGSDGGAARAEPPAQVALHVDDDVVGGVIALDLIDAGLVVVADTAYGRGFATHDVTIARVGESFSVSCTGVDTRAAVVDDGPPALVELELRHRVRALVLQTPGRPAPSATAKPTTQPLPTTLSWPSRPLLSVDDEAAGDDDPRLLERSAALLLKAGVFLSDDEFAGGRVCVDVSRGSVFVGFGEGAGSCVDGGVVVDVDEGEGVDTAVVKDAVVAAVALRPLPDVPPPPPPAVVVARPPAEAALLVVPHAPPRWFALTGRAGGLVRGSGTGLAVDPVLELQLDVPLWSRASAFALVDVNASVDRVAIGEALVAIGPSWSAEFFERARFGVGAGLGVWVHGWYFSGTDAGFAFDPAVVLPVSFDVRLTDRVALALGASLGTITRSRIHQIDSQGITSVAWQRGPVFFAISAGLTFDWFKDPAEVPAPAPVVENSDGLARGEAG